MTYFVLQCSFANLWPAGISFQAQTFFHEGGRVDSADQATGFYGYMKYPVRSDMLICLFPAITDPIQFYWKHCEALESFSASKDLIPVRHEPLDLYVCRQEKIHEEESEHYHSHPYNWEAHLRWYLQWFRREQSGR
jgi:hypothetical protein